MKMKTIHSDRLSYSWSKFSEPRLTVADGETVEIEIQEASSGVITQHSTAADIQKLRPERANPLSGPVFIEGIQPGDGLQVEVLSLEGSGWGWTGIIPEFGLLAKDFSDPFLHISEYDGDTIYFTPEIQIPYAPFPGTIGVARDVQEALPTIPPHRCGGNIDTPYLTRGSTIILPVELAGGLFSVGDTHAAQGLGEVCGTAIESPMTGVFRFSKVPSYSSEFPEIYTPKQQLPFTDSAFKTTLGINQNLENAAMDALRAMVDFLSKEYGISAEVAYCLCSAAGNLSVAQIVNKPQVTVSFAFPLSVFH